MLISCEKDSPAEGVKRKVDFPAAYVVNSDNSISVINLITLQVDTTFIIPSQGDAFAHHIYKSPDNKKLVVALPSVDLSNGHGQLHSIKATGGVAILSALDGTILSSMKTPQANHNAIFSPDGIEIWSALMSHDSPFVKVYNSVNLIEASSIAVGTDASELTFASDGKTAYVAAQESSFVYAIDVQSKEVIKQIKVDFFPTNVWPGNGKVYVENKNRQTINIIDSERNITTEAIDLNFIPGFTIFHELTETLWICDGESAQIRLFKKLGQEWKQTGIIKTGEDTHAIAFSNKLNQAFAVNQRGNSVSIIDLVRNEVVKEISVGLKPNGIVLID